MADPPDSVRSPRCTRGDLGVEPAGQHALVLTDQLVSDVDVLELETRQLGHVGVGLGVEPGREEVDDLDRPSRARGT